MKKCEFCAYERENKSSCPFCGLGDQQPPWRPIEWEDESFLSWRLGWCHTLWRLLSDPREFFRSFNPKGSLIKAWAFALPLIAFISLSSISLQSQLLKGVELNKERSQVEIPHQISLFFIIYELFNWLIVALGFTCIFHFCAFLIRYRKIAWFSIFRLICYGLIPLFVFVLIWQGYSYLFTSNGEGAAGSSGVLISLALATVFWSCQLIRIGFEECFSISKKDSSLIIFSGSLLIMLFVAIEGNLFSR